MSINSGKSIFLQSNIGVGIDFFSCNEGGHEHYLFEIGCYKFVLHDIEEMNDIINKLVNRDIKRLAINAKKFYLESLARDTEEE